MAEFSAIRCQFIFDSLYIIIEWNLNSNYALLSLEVYFLVFNLLYLIKYIHMYIYILIIMKI